MVDQDPTLEYCIFISSLLCVCKYVIYFVIKTRKFAFDRVVKL